MIAHEYEGGIPQQRDLPVDYDPTAPVAALNPDPATVNKLVTTQDPALAPYAVESDGDAFRVPAVLDTRDVAAERLLEAFAEEAPANATDDGALHFLRTVDGVETCGGDGEPWPCSARPHLNPPLDTPGAQG